MVTRLAHFDIPRDRLQNQRIEGQPLKRPVDVVRWLIASQAQDYLAAKWALGLRTVGADDAAVERAFNDGSILRTHLMRPTWHFVTKEDIRWILALTAPQVNRVNGPRYRELGLDGATLRKATSLLARALEGGHELTRDELRAVLARARVGTEGQRMAYILMHAELDAVVCSGARRGRQFTYAPLDPRAPSAASHSREDALAKLTARYFASRGPATVHDFAKWSGLSVSDARNGIEAASELEREVVDGATYWSSLKAPARMQTLKPHRSALATHMLSVYDEYISSYRDRSPICAPTDAKRLVGMGNALGYVLLVDGRIAGTWKRTIAKQTVHVRVTQFRKLSRREQKAVMTAATRFTRFVGEEHLLHLDFA